MLTHCGQSLSKLGSRSSGIVSAVTGNGWITGGGDTNNLSAPVGINNDRSGVEDPSLRSQNQPRTMPRKSHNIAAARGKMRPKNTVEPRSLARRARKRDVKSSERLTAEKYRITCRFLSVGGSYVKGNEGTVTVAISYSGGSSQ